jgi:hypothetical protein
MRRATAAIAAALLALAAGAATGPAVGQTPRENADRFLRFIGSATYSTLVVKKALDTDEQMLPPCRERREPVGRRLAAITVQPEFSGVREVPIAGAWVERVTVRRCGQTVEHNVFAFASPVRGLHVVAGFPGETRTDLELQALVGKTVAERARREAPSCRQVEIVGTAMAERPAGQNSPWAERWTVWRCGQIAAYLVRFQPKPGGGANFTVGN